MGPQEAVATPNIDDVGTTTDIADVAGQDAVAGQFVQIPEVGKLTRRVRTVPLRYRSPLRTVADDAGQPIGQRSRLSRQAHPGATTTLECWGPLRVRPRCAPSS